MIRLVLFDIDGTLIRTGGAGVKAFERAFAAEFGLKGADGLKFAGRTDYSLVREFFVSHGIEPSPKHFEQFFDAYVTLLRETLLESKGALCPGVAQFIADLEKMAHCPAIGLLTGNIRRGAEIKLRHFGIWDKFPFGGFADDHEDRNSIAAVARKRGSERLGAPLHPDEVLVIGDTPHDVRCARAIDAKVLAVATGGATAQELAAHNPDWLVRDLSELSAQAVCCD